MMTTLTIHMACQFREILTKPEILQEFHELPVLKS
jgi:hypothetical protein